MSSDYDATEFVDGDLQARKAPPSATAGQALRAPTREEVDSRVAEAQQKLSELRRAQEELERQRSALEETRRRQMEFQTGRQEMVENLTRGLGLLQEAEFNARRDAEQMAKALAGLREGLSNIQAIHEDTWTRDTFSVELTRALTTLENARMEWNAARLKFPLLAESAQEGGAAAERSGMAAAPLFGRHNFGEMCRLGFALTWPVAVVGLLVLGVLVALLLRH
jgi:chromosome segregation ATPase